MSASKTEIVSTRQKKVKEAILEQLRKFPLVTVACEKAGSSRATYYRLAKEDPEFKKMVEEAIENGFEYINDMSETQIVKLIQGGNLQAIALWLRAHHWKYSNKLELSGNVNVNEEITEKDKGFIEDAVKSLISEKTDSNNNG